MVARGDIWLASLDPTVGSEVRKTRPCLIVSPDEIHNAWRMLLAAPLTTGSRPTRFRIPVRFDGKEGLILLDQIRALDRQRLIRKLGRIEGTVLYETLKVLRNMFAE